VLEALTRACTPAQERTGFGLLYASEARSGVPWTRNKVNLQMRRLSAHEDQDLVSWTENLAEGGRRVYGVQHFGCAFLGWR
jgi:hypothetical protein